MSRRALVRRLVLGGASIAGAMAVADALPEVAPAATAPSSSVAGLAPIVNVTIPTNTWKLVRGYGGFQVRVRFSEDLEHLKVTVFKKTSDGLALLDGFADRDGGAGLSEGERFYTFSALTSTLVRRDVLIASVEAKDTEGNLTWASAKEKLV